MTSYYLIFPKSNFNFGSQYSIDIRYCNDGIMICIAGKSALMVPRQKIFISTEKYETSLQKL